jgi:pimeloyl-ACP methyl ester carboxylesterase
MNRLAALLSLVALSFSGFVSAQVPTAWPTSDGTYTIDHFQFKDGETIDHLRLHYLTLSTIAVPVLWINSADDYINPPELGIAERMVKRMPHAKFILIPTSDATRGHGSHTQAVLWQDDLRTFMQETEKR